MSATWQQIQARGQQSVGVWGQWNPTLKVGADTLTIFGTAVQALPGAAQNVAIQEDVVDDARAARNERVALLTLLGVQMPRKLDGDLDADDAYHKDLLDIRGVEMTGMGSAETRGQMVNSLWLKLNARLAAEVPAKPALTVGGKTQAQLQAALTELPGKKQAVETAVSLLNDRRATLRGFMRTVDSLNKRWYAAWQGEYAEGTPERDALSQIDTGSPGGNDSGGGPVPPVPLPGQPVDVVAVPGAAPGEADVTWTAAADAVDYEAIIRNDAGDLLPSQPPVTGTAMHLTGLPGGTTVSITIRARNATGFGPESATVTVAVA